jgi:hypothetical protein
MNNLPTVALILGALASVYAILAGIEQRTGSCVLRWAIVPFVRLKHWIGAPRRDIKMLQGQVAHLQGYIDRMELQLAPIREEIAALWGRVEPEDEMEKDTNVKYRS